VNEKYTYIAANYNGTFIINEIIEWLVEIIRGKIQRWVTQIQAY